MSFVAFLCLFVYLGNFFSIIANDELHHSAVAQFFLCVHLFQWRLWTGLGDLKNFFVWMKLQRVDMILVPIGESVFSADAH